MRPDAETVTSDAPKRQTSPRERIIAAACDLFYRQGIRAVGVEAVAEAAGTNKMTLYRHFPSKDELVAECLREFAKKADARWKDLERAHPEPRARLHAWLEGVAEHIAASGARGCAHANAAVELPDKDHPARQVIETFKKAQRQRLVELCCASGLTQPEDLAHELFLLVEGAFVCRQSIGLEGPARLVRMGDAIIAAHEREMPRSPAQTAAANKPHG
jgi:AcrR family transcriptional regulator